jgi:hypothetical protein
MSEIERHWAKLKDYIEKQITELRNFLKFQLI